MCKKHARLTGRSRSSCSVMTGFTWIMVLHAWSDGAERARPGMSSEIRRAVLDGQDALAESGGYLEIAKQIKAKYYIHPGKDRSFHYLPYHTDSSFEQRFLRDALAFPQLEQLGLEVYYNGDRAMTEFKIKCYKTDGSWWQYIGMYTPDFLILQRRDGKIHKAIIVETKGEIYANDPTFKEKRRFMETEFLRQNNKEFGYARFEYLYLEDTMPDQDRIVTVQEKIKEFFW